MIRWRPELHHDNQRWIHNRFGCTQHVTELVHTGVPHSLWVVLLLACEYSFLLAEFKEAVDLLVRSGVCVPSGHVRYLPLTRPDDTMRGHMVTLMAAGGTHRTVPFVAQAHMRLPHIASQITILRNSTYVVNGRVEWPDLEPNLTTWWHHCQLPDAHNRTHKLVATAVYSLV